jgi:Family of unknown function (DUF6325)
VTNRWTSWGRSTLWSWSGRGGSPKPGKCSRSCWTWWTAASSGILDIAFLAKDQDGSVSGLELGDLKEVAEAFAQFEGASSGLLGFEDLEEAANALEPGTSAAVIVWENRWAAPVAAALRRSGGQLVASGRLPVQAILAALDAAEAAN